ASIALARAGGTTGEWGGVMREVFGEYRAPTGVGGATAPAAGLADVAAHVRSIPGGPPKFLVAKPGLDGHSSGAEQIASSARDEDPDVIGMSILSGSHLELVPDVLDHLREMGVDTPVVVGGIIPEEDRPRLAEIGIARVYTPKDFEIAKIMRDIADLAVEHRS
ncbi:MAG: cobalamin-dependent protein, partial [Ilumatobacter sp.]